MKTLLALSLLFLCSCGNTPMLPTQAKPAEITAIEVANAGGQMGYTSRLRFTADSVFYVRNITMAPHDNDSFQRANDAATWQSLTSDLDLDRFWKAQEEESRQPVDGVDTEISVFTNRDTITKRNANSSADWNQLRLKAETYLQRP